MPARVLCLLTDGVEEIEAVTPIDLLRRAGIEVTTAALRHRQLTGRSGIVLEADTLLAETGDAPATFDLLLIPGGPGVAELRENGRPAQLAAAFAAAGKPVAAICAAPLVLLDAGLLAHTRHTAHASVRAQLPGCLDERIVTDGLLITSRGAGTALDFALALVTRLAGPDTAARIATDIMA